MKIIRQDEFTLSASTKESISNLFEQAFDGYPNGLIYYNQVPDFRFLAWDGDKLSGHVGVSYRKIGIAKQAFSVFGIVDLCVAPEIQLNNVGSMMLKSLMDLAVPNQVDFLMLTSEVDEFYIKNGFQIVQNPCRWLVIHDHESMGVLRRQLSRGLMIKTTGDREWPAGEVDFMGHMFLNQTYFSPGQLIYH